MRRSLVLPAALVALSTSLAVFASSVAVAAPKPEVRLQGTVAKFVMDGRGQAVGKEKLVLRTKDRTYDLNGPQALAVKPGSKVTATGTVTGTTLTTSAPAITTVALDETSPSLRTLVMLASWTAPDSVTPQSARETVFGDAAAWFHSVSFGKTRLTGDVTPWLQIAGPNGGLCMTNHVQTMAQAKAAALASGFDPAGYDRYVLYFPYSDNPDCANYGGWAYQPGTEVWVNGGFGRRILAHELGHSLGLGHAHAYPCQTSGIATFLKGSCTNDEYGDPYDAMGNAGWVASYSTAAKSKLGWLDGRVATLAVGGTTTLAPSQSATGTAAATIALGSRTYWLEWRTANSVDAALPAGATQGVQVRLQDAALASGAGLLDASPDGDLTSSVVSYGARLRLPEGPAVVVGSPAGSSLPVSLVAEAEDRTAPGEVVGVVAKAGRNSVTLTWTNPKDADFRATAVYVASSAGALSSTLPSYTGPGTSLTVPYDGSALTIRFRTVDTAGNVSSGSVGTLGKRGFLLG